MAGDKNMHKLILALNKYWKDPQTNIFKNYIITNNIKNIKRDIYILI